MKPWYQWVLSHYWPTDDFSASGRQENPRRCPARRCYLHKSPIYPATQVELSDYRDEGRRTVCGSRGRASDTPLCVCGGSPEELPVCPSF